MTWCVPVCCNHMGWVWSWKNPCSRGGAVMTEAEDPTPCTPAAGGGPGGNTWKTNQPHARAGELSPLVLLLEPRSSVRPVLPGNHGNQRFTLKIKKCWVSGRGCSSFCKVWACCLPESLIKPGPDSASALLLGKTQCWQGCRKKQYLLVFKAK